MRGSADWGIYAPKTTIATITDIGELAVRLGSIVTFDRRGDVVWLDDFEDGIIKWEAKTDGTGSVITSDSTTARNGGKCAKLVPGSADLDTATINHFGPTMALSKTGIEISFTIDADHEQIDIHLDFFTGSNLLAFRIRLLLSDLTLRYRDENATYVSIATITQPRTDTKTFHTLKLVVDPDTQKYVRLIYDNTEYDISAKLPRVSSDTTDSHLLFTARVVNSDAGGNPAAYFDDAIVTQNEP